MEGSEESQRDVPPRQAAYSGSRRSARSTERSMTMMETSDYASERYREMVARGLTAARRQRLAVERAESTEAAARAPQTGWLRTLLTNMVTRRATRRTEAI